MHIEVTDTSDLVKSQRTDLNLPARNGLGGAVDHTIGIRNLTEFAPDSKLENEADAAGQHDISVRGGQLSPWGNFLRTRGGADWWAFATASGVQATRRVSTQNETFRLDGHCAVWNDHTIDYKDQGQAVVMRLLNLDQELRPQWAGRPMNGGLYALWQFARPVLTGDSSYARSFLIGLTAELGVHCLFPMLDPRATNTPGYIHPCPPRWVDVQARLERHGHGADAVPRFMPESVLLRVAQAIPWAMDKRSTKVDIRKVFEAAGEVHTIDRPLEVGKACNTFWLDDKSGLAIVRHSGVQVLCCMGATKQHYPWSEILGASVWEKVSTFQPSDVTEGIVYLPPNYLIFNKGLKRWVPAHRSDIPKELRIRGCSYQIDPSTGISQVEMAEAYIRENRCVDQATPTPFREPGIFELNGKKVLNTLNLQVLQPSGKLNVSLSDLPFLSWFWENFFAKKEAGTWMLYHLGTNYARCLKHAPRPAQAVFIQGPTNSGKTLLVQSIIGRLFGSAPARPFQAMAGKTTFNKASCESGVWLLDDECAPANDRERASFYAAIKQLTSQMDQDYTAKYSDSQRTQATGLLLGLCNEGDSSELIIPDINQSNSDKISMFRCRAATAWPVRGAEIDEALAKELPDFAQFLLDLVAAGIPEALQPERHTRYDLEPYREESVQSMGSRSSQGGGILDLMAWFFRRSSHWQGAKAATTWSGTVTDLLHTLAEIEDSSTVLRSWSQRSLDIALRQESFRGESSPVTVRVTGQVHIYTIRREESAATMG